MHRLRSWTWHDRPQRAPRGVGVGCHFFRFEFRCLWSGRLSRSSVVAPVASTSLEARITLLTRLQFAIRLQRNVAVAYPHRNCCAHLISGSFLCPLALCQCRPHCACYVLGVRPMGPAGQFVSFGVNSGFRRVCRAQSSIVLTELVFALGRVLALRRQELASNRFSHVDQRRYRPDACEGFRPRAAWTLSADRALHAGAHQRAGWA